MRKLKSLILVAVLSCAVMLSSCLDGESEFNTVKQFKKEQKQIEEYLAENGISAQQDSIFEMYYVVQDLGNDVTPNQNSWVNVTFDGGVLGASSKFIREDSVYYPLYSLLEGWRVLLPKIGEGGSMTMYIPSVYGFGREPTSDGQIPGNSTLVFDVQLDRVLEQEVYEDLLINSYIDQNGLNAQQDSITNMYYVIVEEGDGDSPTSTSTVVVDYEGRTLNSLEVFDSGIEATFNLSSLIDGWRFLMPYAKEGGTILMFIPSEYGYGPSQVGVIPPNSTLLFEVTLIEVVQ